MRLSWAKAALGVALATLVVAPLSSAYAQRGSDSLVDVKFKDADMLAATRVLTQKTGINFVIVPSSEGFKKITMQVSGVTPEEAIRYICTAAGASFRRDEAGTYIISNTKPVVEDPTPTPAPKKPKVVRAIKILKASARDVYNAILYRMPFDSTQGFAELKRFVEMGRGDETGMPYAPNLSANSNEVNTYHPVGLTSHPTPLTGAESGNDVALPGEAANAQGGRTGGGGINGGGGGINGGGGSGFGGGGIGGQNGGGQLIGGQGLVGDSIDYITYDPTDNSLVVRGSDEDVDELQQYINLFDVAPKQVLIKVEFIQTTETLDKSLGSEFLFNRGTIFAGTRPGAFVRAADPVFINWASGNVTARLRASLTEGNAKVVTSPILRTLNNQPAVVTSFVTTYIFINSTAVNSNNIYTTYQPLPLTATTLLGVAPRINDDGTITMYLTPQVSNFVGTSVGPNGEEIPNQAGQRVQLVARVKNGETIVVGGLNTKNENNSVTRVPVLSDLPIIGQFFKSTTRGKSNSELLVFVTPTVIDDDNPTSSASP